MKKGIGDKVLGWFVVQEDAEPHATADANADADALAEELADERSEPVRAPAPRRAVGACPGARRHAGKCA